MKHHFLFLLALFSLSANAQNWSTFLEPSRAINWSNAGFAIPNYTTNCAAQPTLIPNSASAAAANTTAIQNALASCDSTHNVLNIPAGTYYIAGFVYGTQGNQVVRGAGANQTELIITANVSCGGATATAVCMQAANWTYSGDSRVQAPSGSLQCSSWASGYSQGTTSIGLAGCGSAPTVGQLVVLDQANDTTNTNGVYTCDGSTPNCTYEGSRNADGRTIGGSLYSTQQVVMITSSTSLGGGSYTVGISPGVYSTNIRSGQTPGAWFPGTVKNLGLENLTLDETFAGNSTLNMFSCYQCWVKGVAFLNGDRSSVWIYQGSHDVIRDSYFYGARSHAATSYNIETDTVSDCLIENNIMQQVTTTLNYNGGTMGCVADYNFSIDNIFGDGTWAWGIYASHSADDNFNLFEGNIANNIIEDNASGSANQNTAYRNLLSGKQPGTINLTVPFVNRANNRNFNIVGNVLGTPGYHTQYAAYATSQTTSSGASGEYVSIYDLGGGGTGFVCAANPGSSTLCDPLSYSTSVRWGNYDTVNAATQWNLTEASPAANPYVSANFTSSYFASLGQTLPASLYYSSVPAWWPSGKVWPSIGPDVSTGNIGICTGTYAGWMGTSSSQCTGGTLSAAWASHATSIPAMDCYLNMMGGPPNGSGNALSFNASACYTGSTGTSGSTPASPSGLVATAD